VGPTDGSEDGTELKDGAELGIRDGNLLTLGINESWPEDTLVGEVLRICVKVGSSDGTSDGEELGTNNDDGISDGTSD